MKSFSLVCLAAVVAIIASTDGVQADTPVAGAGDETLAETKEVEVRWNCYYGDKFVGRVVVSDQPPPPVGYGWSATARGVMPPPNLPAELCNRMFDQCKGHCYAK